jgi:hypothetical protein
MMISGRVMIPNERNKLKTELIISAKEENQALSLWQIIRWNWRICWRLIIKTVSCYWKDFNSIVVIKASSGKVVNCHNFHKVKH